MLRSTLKTLLPLALALSVTAARAEDTEPPQISHTPVTAAEKGQPIAVRARITDASKFFPQVFYKWDGAANFEKPIDMKAMKGKKNKHWFEATIPPKGTQAVEYYIEAYDEFGNGPARAGSPEAPNKIEFAQPAAAAEPPAAEPAAEAPAAEAPKTEEAPATAEAPKTEEAPAEVAPPAEAPKKEVAETKTEEAPAMEAAKPPPAATATGSGQGRTWTWVVGGTGLGMLAGGALTGLAFKKADDAYSARLNDKTNNPSTLQQQYDANKTLGTTSTIMLIGGTALLAGGVALYFFENPSGNKRADAGTPEPAKLQFAAAPLQNGAAAVVAGRF